MKGWEIYQKDWGCKDWTLWDSEWEFVDAWQSDKIFCWLSWAPCRPETFICIRQPRPVQVLVDERRLRHQIKLMQDQWRRALYDPTRAVCKKRIEAEFRDLSEQEDRIGCNDT